MCVLCAAAARRRSRPARRLDVCAHACAAALGGAEEQAGVYVQDGACARLAREINHFSLGHSTHPHLAQRTHAQVSVGPSRAVLGKPVDFPSFGWDNEYGRKEVRRTRSLARSAGGQRRAGERDGEGDGASERASV